MHDVVLHHGIAKEVIIVNEGSKDSTVEAVKPYMATDPALDIKLFEQPRNMVKGSAIHCGINEATCGHIRAGA